MPLTGAGEALLEQGEAVAGDEVVTLLWIGADQRVRDGQAAVAQALLGGEFVPAQVLRHKAGDELGARKEAAHQCGVSPGFIGAGLTRAAGRRIEWQHIEPSHGGAQQGVGDRRFDGQRAQLVTGRGGRRVQVVDDRFDKGPKGPPVQASNHGLSPRQGGQSPGRVPIVIPAPAGIQVLRAFLDPGFRGGDEGVVEFNGPLREELVGVARRDRELGDLVVAEHSKIDRLAGAMGPEA